MTPVTFKGNERKIEQKELPNYSILCLLIAYMRQFETLVTLGSVATDQLREMGRGISTKF